MSLLPHYGTTEVVPFPILGGPPASVADAQFGTISTIIF
jgi:hypothetical protein